MDGISTVDVIGNSPLTNAFSYRESIAEMKVQGVGSNAEFGQEGNITTISKTGTNHPEALRAFDKDLCCRWHGR